jgi:hypothetical protein
VQQMRKGNAHGQFTGTTGQAGLPRAIGFNGCFVLSPECRAC